MSLSDRPPRDAPVDRSIPRALTDLFQEVILDHYRRPRNRGPLEDATHAVTMNNPRCGDVITLSLVVQGDRIERARFEGRGCSISQASASMMTERLEGARIDEARDLSRTFASLLHGDRDREGDETLGDLRALGGVSKFPVRIKCALLGFNCLDELIEEVADPDRQGGGRPGAEP